MNHSIEDPEEQYDRPATEEQTEKIDAIVGGEVLGYDGSSRGEHSGQVSVPTEDGITDALANNRAEEVK